MPRDMFGKALAVGDNLIIDAKVAEIFDPEEDDVHIRIVLTNGNGQSIVLRADAVAKVIEDAEKLPEPAADATADAATGGAETGKDAGKEKPKEKARSAK